MSIDSKKKSYAIDNILKIISDDKLREVKIKYYVCRIPKLKLAKEIGLSHQLMGAFLNRIGKPTKEDIMDLNSINIIMNNLK